MIYPSWLGYYWNCNDEPWDGPVHRLHLFPTAPEIVSFEYYFDIRSTHGYGMQFQQGLVRSVTEDALVIDSTHRYETSWEDYCKEYVELHDSQPQTQTIRIESVARQPPTLFYNGANLTFKCSDSEAYAAFFVQARAKYGAAAESR